MRAGALRGVLVGEGDEGMAYAAFDVAAHHVQPRIGASRLAARLAPFRSRDEAAAALAGEGVAVIEDLAA